MAWALTGVFDHFNSPRGVTIALGDITSIPLKFCHSIRYYVSIPFMARPLGIWAKVWACRALVRVPDQQVRDSVTQCPGGHSPWEVKPLWWPHARPRGVRGISPPHQPPRAVTVRIPGARVEGAIMTNCREPYIYIPYSRVVTPPSLLRPPPPPSSARSYC